jgi:hypothetical protein
MVLALEPDLTDIVRETKFRVFNAEWLNAVENDDDHDQVCFNGTVCDSLLSALFSLCPQFEHHDGGESAYHNYSNTWAEQEGLWNHGLKFVGDDEED